MYRSDNGRKFFTLVLVICMLVFQVVDFHAAKEACSRDEKQVAQLVKAWGWSRPAVLAFVDQLQKYEILEVCNMVTSKMGTMDQSGFRLRSGGLPYQENCFCRRLVFQGRLRRKPYFFTTGGSLIPGFMANALKHGGLPANFLATSCGKPR